MSTLKIGNAHNESGQKFFASNDLTTNSTDLLWKGARVLTEASFSVSGDFEGTGSADSPLSWKGFKAENAEGTVLSETVKTIKAGTNVTLSAQGGVLTIESEGGTEIDTNAMVRIYDATVGAETGVVTITDGTPVTNLRIGDEIRTPDGVYQKIKDSITTSGDPATSSINISGFTNPSNANGTYVFHSDKKWKHESENYWVTTSSNHWVISSMEAPAAPSAGLCYAPMNEGEMPWDVTSWQLVSSYGTPVLEQKTADTVVDNTIDLFEYASLPIDPANIVQSVNGNKPDASGNVTIETSSGGLTSVSVSDGLTGNGTSGSPIKLDLSNYGTRNAISLTTFGGFTFKISATTAMSIGTDANVHIATHTYLAGNSEADVYFHGNATNTANGLVVLGADGKIPTNLYDAGGGTTIDWANVNATEIKLNGSEGIWFNTTMNDIFLKPQNGAGTLFIDAMDIQLNECGLNQPTGLVQLTPEGKIPTELYDAGGGDIDLSNYSTTSNISLKTTGSSTGITLGSTNGTVSIYSGYDGNGLSIGSASCSYSGGNVSLSGKLSTSVGNYGAGTTTINATSLTNLKLKIGSNGTASSANTAGGLVVVGSDGKIPSNLYDAGGSGTEIDWSNVNAELISFSADKEMAFSSYGGISISGGNLLINTSSVNFGEAGGTVITFDLTKLDDLKIFHADTATTSTPNTAGGFAIVGSDGKLPASILPESSGGDTSALETRVTTLETTVGTLNTTVDEILADYGEGSGALVYRVVASATEPENPTEGMLWIKTE